MKKAFIGLLLMICSTIGFTQTGSLEGKVVSGGEPVAFAIIVIKGLNTGTDSDTLGKYRIKEIPVGKYKINVSAIGYQVEEKWIEIIEGKTVRLNFYLQIKDSELEEVVVTGTMKEVKKSDSPIPVEVYTPAYFKKNPNPSIFESLQMVNGVQPQLNCNVCNTGDIHINGMEGPYTMITIDGMPIVSSLSTVYGLSGIPNSLVQRIEVVKGPASTLYGSEAVGGLINVITKDPATVPKFYADVFSTSQAEVNADVAFKVKVGNASSLLGINYFNFKNKLDVNKDNFTDVTLQDRISIFNKWDFSRKSTKKASIAARVVYEDRWGGEMQWNSTFRGGDSIYGESIYTKRGELIGNYQLPMKENISIQFSLNTHHQNSVYGTTSYIARQDIAFGQLVWNRKAGARHELVAGIPLRYTYYDDNTPATASPDTTRLINLPSRVLLPGVFIQDDYSITEKTMILSGLRYDYNSDHGSIVTPRLSVKHKHNANNTFRLTLGNGYRVVNLFTEDHAALTGAREVVIVESLKPEKSYNANLNYQKYISLKNGFIELDASAFYTYFTNKIVGDFLSDPNKIIYDNLDGYAISKGITLNSSVSFTFPLKLMAGFTWMDVYSVEKNENSEKVKVAQLHAPAFSGTYALTYQVKRYNVSIDYTGRVMGPMHLPVLANDYRPDKSPWFSLQNIQVTKKIKKWEVYGGVKNLLNFIPKDPLMRPFDPFDKHVSDPVSNPNGYTFDTTYNYAPIQGIRGFLGVRVSF
ncbi:MAG TPA: TonB-dependent receptor [Cytophagaceae bacterium]